MQAHLQYMFVCLCGVSCVCVGGGGGGRGAGLARTGFLPVVTMASRGFAFTDEKREGESKRGGDQEDGG